MRVANWNPSKYDGEFFAKAMDRLEQAAEVVADSARAQVPVGTISRPMYKSGPYANQPWTARDAGSLKKTIRVVKKYGEGALIAESRSRNIRVYAGNYITYYAKIVEFTTPYLRPALNRSKAVIRSIMENGA